MDAAGLQNYSEEVAAGWRAFFEELPPGSTVLDLCTGNGAIALLAAEVARKRGVDLVVIGVDSAAIDPMRHVGKFREDLKGIHFRPGVQVEDLPFADHSACAIVSQYGIEYSDLDRSLTEVGRVLSPSGRIRFVLHASDGIVAEGAARCAKDADFLLDQIDLPGAAARCLQAVLSFEREPAAPPDKRAVAEESFDRFQAALEAAASYVGSATDPEMIRVSGSVLADTFSKRAYFDLPRLLAKVDEVTTEIAAHRARSLALVRSAVSPEDLSAISDRLGGAGVSEVRWSPLTKKGRLIGYVLEGSREARS
jgi:SAM-dependent methyltransferase